MQPIHRGIIVASVNKVILVGHLGKDPEVRYTASGDPIANLTVATSESWKDKATGEKKEQTEWHRCSCFGKLAEICGQWLKKGAQVYIEGSLRTRKWQDKDGQDRYTTEIRADEMKMLGRREGGDAPMRGGEGGGWEAGSQSAPARQPAAPAQRPQPQAAPPQQSGGFGDFDDDIPFNKLGAGRTHLVI